MKYIHNLLLAIDRVGNAIAGGNASNTISARVGHTAPQPKKILWKTTRACIDWCFEPIDGKGHCQQAANDERHYDFAAGSAFGLAVIIIFVLVICPVLGGVLRLVVTIVNLIKNLMGKT